MIEHTANRKKPRLNTYSLRTQVIFTAFVAFMLGSLPFLPEFPRLSKMYPKVALLACWFGATLGAAFALARKRTIVGDRYWFTLIVVSAVTTWGSFIQHNYGCAQAAERSPQFPGVGGVGFLLLAAAYAGFLAFAVAWFIPKSLIQQKINPEPLSHRQDSTLGSFVSIPLLDRLSLVDRMVVGIALVYLCLCIGMIMYETFAESLGNIPSPISFLLGLPWSPLIYLSFLFCPMRFRVPLLIFVYAAPPLINVFYLLRSRGIRFKLEIGKGTDYGDSVSKENR